MYRSDLSIPSRDECVRAVAESDGELDGVFWFGVTSTGIYCRPSCSSRTPKASNMRFFASPEDARADGFRACKRCRPDAEPGSPDWNPQAAAAARALELIADGLVDRAGVSGLATELGYSERQLNRVLREEIGESPVRLARRARAEKARALIETTDMPIRDVADATGFASVRQFNTTIREVFDATPTELRKAAA